MLVPAACHGFEGGMDLPGRGGSPFHGPPSLLSSLNCPSGPFTFLSHPPCSSAPLPLNQGLGLCTGTLSCSGLDLEV